MNAITPFAAHLIDEGIRNTIRAKRHLASLSPERRAQLEAEWVAERPLTAAEYLASLSAERRAELNREWENGRG